MTITIPSRGTAEKKINVLIHAPEEVQEQVAILSDELDSDTLEAAEDLIDEVINKIGDAIEEQGREESCHRLRI